MTTTTVTVNDVHSELNETLVSEVVAVDSLEAIRGVVRRAKGTDKPIAIAGGRHAMGGQQFCRDGIVVDSTALARVLAFDAERGTIDVQAGIQWPALIEYLATAQASRPMQWAIAQKQTGADRLSIGGAISANVHGRGLTMKPFVADIESFVLVNAEAEVITCSREENAELFALAVGGYGLFGCIYSAKLRLRPRQVLERVVELRQIDDLMPSFDQRIRDGFVYGDFQFVTVETAADFLRRGVFSCYRPVGRDGPPPTGQRALSHDDWQKLMYLAHTDERRAVELYTSHYLATSGQLYYSDAHQLADYTDGYHRVLDRALGSAERATEMITEIYVPRARLADFLAAAADDVVRRGANIIYGTIRLIQPEEESFLAWATQPWACVIFNLHTVHTPSGLEQAADAFRGLIDLAIERGGSYYLTYHHWATRQQLEACYPTFPEFLRRKVRYDPKERFQSEWYRHYRAMF